jgi:membrane protein DedA with SNARE-associated domain
MNDPRISALICAAVAAWLGYTIFFSADAPSTFLVVVQWTFFVVALLGAIAAVIRILRENGR